MVAIGPGFRGWPVHPLVYEINAWTWVDGLRRRFGSGLDLGSVPGVEWDAIAALHPDAVWLMGVWRRSPAGLAIAEADPDNVAGWRTALPDLGPVDVVGSPYCIREYRVDDALGGPEGLAAARAELASRGIGLVLDFVPNHVAPDHRWVADHPERFVSGTDEDLERDPASFARHGGAVLALGRDPYFPAWADVVQLDAFSPSLREAAAATVADVAEQCDGVRCDMAMLLLSDIFGRTWGDRVGPAPATEYWDDVIPAVRSGHPDFRFLAEAYWDREADLQRLGFDHCYDKRLYDRLTEDSPASVRDHLAADPEYQHGLVRFLENHDEPRAAATFPPAQQRVAAVTAFTLPGARLLHEGQIEGRRVRLPVFLARRPDEPSDVDLESFYRSLLEVAADPTLRNGTWALCAVSGWPGDNTCEDLVAWSWDGPTRWLVVVNLGDRTARAEVRVPWADVAGRRWNLGDPTTQAAFERDGDTLASGLYVELGPYCWHLFRVTPVPNRDEVIA